MDFVVEFVAWLALFVGVLLATVNGAISALGGDRVGAILWGMFVLGDLALGLALALAHASNLVLLACVWSLAVSGGGLVAIYRLERKGLE